MKNEIYRCYDLSFTCEMMLHDVDNYYYYQNYSY